MLSTHWNRWRRMSRIDDNHLCLLGKSSDWTSMRRQRRCVVLCSAFSGQRTTTLWFLSVSVAPVDVTTEPTEFPIASSFILCPGPISVSLHKRFRISVYLRGKSSIQDGDRRTADREGRALHRKPNSRSPCRFVRGGSFWSSRCGIDRRIDEEGIQRRSRKIFTRKKHASITANEWSNQSINQSIDRWIDQSINRPNWKIENQPGKSEITT